jgi:hypothetical protein
MKTLYFLSISLIFLFGCSNTNQKKTDQPGVGEQVSGTPLEVVDVVTILADPAAYDGKEVALKGTVVHVCKHSGKRLHLLGSDESSRLRVEAGEIGQFERELEGSEIIATGIFRREVIDEEYLAKWATELENDGKSGDHMTHQEQMQQEGQIQQYREMMRETVDGHLQNFWVDGISFQTVEKEVAM